MEGAMDSLLERQLGRWCQPLVCRHASDQPQHLHKLAQAAEPSGSQAAASALLGLIQQRNSITLQPELGQGVLQLLSRPPRLQSSQQ